MIHDALRLRHWCVPVTSFDLSHRVDLDHLRLPIARLDTTLRELNIEFLVVGATARDLVLLYGCDVDVGRATADLDVENPALDGAGWYVSSGYRRYPGTHLAGRIPEWPPAPSILLPFSAPARGSATGFAFRFQTFLVGSTRKLAAPCDFRKSPL